MYILYTSILPWPSTYGPGMTEPRGMCKVNLAIRRLKWAAGCGTHCWFWKCMCPGFTQWLSLTKIVLTQARAQWQGWGDGSRQFEHGRRFDKHVQHSLSWHGRGLHHFILELYNRKMIKIGDPVKSVSWDNLDVDDSRITNHVWLIESQYSTVQYLDYDSHEISKQSPVSKCWKDQKIGFNNIVSSCQPSAKKHNYSTSDFVSCVTSSCARLCFNSLPTLVFSPRLVFARYMILNNNLTVTSSALIDWGT